MFEPDCLLAALRSTLCKNPPTLRDKWESKSIGPIACRFGGRAQIQENFKRKKVLYSAL